MHSKFGMHQLAHPMGLVEKLLAIQLFIFFQKSGYDKCHSETDFKTLLLKIIFQCLRFLDRIQENMFESDTNIVWTVQTFHGCKDSSIR